MDERQLKRWMRYGLAAALLAAAPFIYRAQTTPRALAQGPTVEVVEGWTGVLDFRLLADGAALDVTGMTVELLLTKSDGTAVDTTSDTSVINAADGQVRYSPDATDLDAADSPIAMRWKVTDGTGKVMYHPSGRTAFIVVHEL